MNVCRVGAAALLATITGTASAFAAPAGAQEAADVDVGWWTRNPAQSAPENGFAIASAPDGPVTVAAVVLSTRGVVLEGTITAVETGGVAQAAASVIVCPTTDPIVLPEPGGSLEDAPDPDCERGSVPFERDDETLRWSADISTLLDGESRDDVALALVPEPSDGPLQPTFDVRFAAPEAELVGTGADADSDRPVLDNQTTASTRPEPSPSGPAFPEASPTPLTPGPPSGAETSPAATDDSPAPIEEPSAPTSTDQTDEFATAPTATSANGTDSDDRPGVGRAVSYVVVSTLAGALVAGASRFSRHRAVA